MHKRKLPPDTRPNWRDPAMPVIRNYRMGDGTTKTEVDPDYERRYREHLIASAPPQDFPHYKDDPTYHMKRKPKPLANPSPPSAALPQRTKPIAS